MSHFPEVTQKATESTPLLPPPNSSVNVTEIKVDFVATAKIEENSEELKKAVKKINVVYVISAAGGAVVGSLVGAALFSPMVAVGAIVGAAVGTLTGSGAAMTGTAIAQKAGCLPEGAFKETYHPNSPAMCYQC